jgi:hypothetical protein
MSCTSGASLKQHIIEHEILGVGSSGGGASGTIIDGYLTYTDTSRANKILSTSRLKFEASKKDKAEDVYLRVNNSLASSKSSFRMTHNGTITAASLQLSSASTCSLHIYRNGLTIPLLTLSLTATVGSHQNNLDVDISESDVIQFYVDGSCHNPVAWIEIAWRF